MHQHYILWNFKHIQKIFAKKKHHFNYPTQLIPIFVRFNRNFCDDNIVKKPAVLNFSKDKHEATIQFLLRGFFLDTKIVEPIRTEFDQTPRLTLCLVQQTHSVNKPKCSTEYKTENHKKFFNNIPRRRTNRTFLENFESALTLIVHSSHTHTYTLDMMMLDAGSALWQPNWRRLLRDGSFSKVLLEVKRTSTPTRTTYTVKTGCSRAQRFMRQRPWSSQIGIP